MKNKIAFLLIFCCTLLCCQKKQSICVNVTPATFASHLKNTADVQLIDVRTPEEFHEAHIKNAQNIDWNGSQFEVEVAKLDKSKPILVYCKGGGRSKRAAQKLQELGFATIYELNGGFVQWSLDGFQK